MAFIVLYPAVAALAMFVIGVIMVILRFGPRMCGVRHTALTSHHEWDDQVYEQKVSYA